MSNPAALTINELAANGSINQPSAQTVDTDGVIPMDANGLTDRLIMEVVNSAGQILTVTFKAGNSAAAHTASDLAVAVPATTGKKIIGPFESARFVRTDGKINVDFKAASSTPNAAVRVYRLPKA